MIGNTPEESTDDVEDDKEQTLFFIWRHDIPGSAQLNLIGKAKCSWIVRSGCSAASEQLRLSRFLDQVNVFVPDAESALQVDTRLIRKSHAGLEQYFLVPLVQVRRLVR